MTKQIQESSRKIIYLVEFDEVDWSGFIQTKTETTPDREKHS